MSRKATSLLCVVTGSILLIIGCSKSSEDMFTTPTQQQCDTVAMTYSNDVKPILEVNCYSCHGNGNSQNGISLDSYEDVRSVAQHGILIGVITHAAGFPPMPDGGGKLSDCDINKIQDWINRGAINN